MATEQLIIQHLDIWTTAIKRRSTAGRGSSSKVELYGIKRLRELILELAVRGLLVPQDPKDEPASELLKKIAAEKAKLVKEGKIKTEKPLPAVAEEETPFRQPKNWTFARWGQIAEWAIGSGFPNSAQGETDQEILFAKVSDMNLSGNEKYIVTTVNSVSRETAKRIKAKPHPPGTVVFPKIGGAIATNKRRVLVRDTAIDNNCLGLIPGGAVTTDYLYLLLSSVDLSAYQSGTSVPALSQGNLELIVAGLPPLPEQHRIVAKVDELMALCDQLEQQTDASLGAHQTLVETLLNALTSATDHAQFASSWQRIAEHFDTLFTTEESIDQLKQTILQLAVMGKLVPQDPNDEPASELLKRISHDKSRLLKERRGKQEKPLPSSKMERTLPYIPRGWACERFGNFAVIERGGSPRPIQAYLTDQSDGLNWIKISDTDIGGKYILGTKEKILKEGLHKTRMVYPGDFLLTNSMSFGRPYITTIEGCIHDGWLRISPSAYLDKDFLYLLLSSPYIVKSFTDAAAGAVVQNLNSDKVREVLILLPPLAEQHRIVAKVEELISFCDKLKTCLSTAEQLRLNLVEAISDATLNPPSEKVIPFPDAAAREARRNAIGCHTIATLNSHRSFGRTKLMKVIYLTDTHVGADITTVPERAAAGPFDKWIYHFEELAEAEGWFSHEEAQGERNKVRYLPKAGLAAQAAKVHELLDASQVAELDRLLKLFTDLSTEETEIVATLFAAWNDFLIDGHTPDDAEVIREVRENWTPEKQRFKPEQLQTWLDWMRKNKLVPHGRGPRTVQQTKLFH